MPEVGASGAKLHSGYPKPFVVQPSAPHTHTFIFLDGQSSNGKRFGTEFLQSGITSKGDTFQNLYPGMKFIFPTAKVRRRALFRKATATQWFDMGPVYAQSQHQELQAEGLRESAQFLHSIIKRELKSIPPRNVILGGISQGCAMALWALLTFGQGIGGLVGLCGWLPFRQEIEDLINTGKNTGKGTVSSDMKEDESLEDDSRLLTTNSIRGLISMDALGSSSLEEGQWPTTPLFIGHGELDRNVPRWLGEQAALTLRSLGLAVTWKSYAGLGHWYKIPDEIDDMVLFLREAAGVNPGLPADMGLSVPD